ncbi:MAG: WD40 repeat domain-containing protein [Solirubrobacteraceae bacterium]
MRRIYSLGNLIVNRLTVWNLATGRIVRTIILPDRSDGPGAESGGTAASPAELTPDGRFALVTVEGGGLVRVDLATGVVDERPGTQTDAQALAVSPNGRFYAVGREDGTVNEYDARSLQIVRHLTLSSPIRALVFSPNSQLLVAKDADSVVYVWDACAVCENPAGLARLARQESIRSLTPSEQATFGTASP